jgi:hypothetical protein
MSNHDMSLNEIKTRYENEYRGLRLDLWWGIQRDDQAWLIAEVERLERERDAAVAALKPFADFADPHNRAPDHIVITVGSSMARKQLTMGDCYKARQALTTPAEEAKDDA